MVIKINGTEAVDCGVIYDLPHDANIDITSTKAIRVQTVLKVRDNQHQFREKLLSYLVEGTPVDVIDSFIKSIETLDSKDVNSVELATYRSGLDKFLKGNVAGAVSFASSIVTLISALPF